MRKGESCGHNEAKIVINNSSYVANKIKIMMMMMMMMMRMTMMIKIMTKKFRSFTRCA